MTEQNTMPELKPCPFCGGSAAFDIDDGFIFVRCLDCGAQGKSFAYDWGREDVMKAREEVREIVGKYWNTPADTVDELLKKVRDQIEFCRKHDHWPALDKTLALIDKFLAE